MKLAIDYMIDWAIDTNWKRHIVNKLLSTEDCNEEQLLTEIIEVITKKTEVNLMIQKQTQEENDMRLVIKEVKNPLNINALSNDTNFTFGDKLNVFYGENGSGKSSYVRIFRKLAQHYHTSAKELKLLPNIYLLGSKEMPTNTKQSVEVSYNWDGNSNPSTKIDINLEHNHLRQINVFDNESVVPLLNSNLTFSVLPQGFKYFNKIILLLDILKIKLEQKILNKEAECNAVFADSSYDNIKEEINDIFEKVKQFGALQSYINQKFPLQPNHNQLIDEMDIKIKELEGTNIADKLKILLSQKNKLETLVSAISTLSSKLSLENIQLVNGLIQQYNYKVQEEKKLNVEFKQSASFLENLNEYWFELIRNTQQYYKSLNREGPIVGEKCVLCSQSLAQNEVHIIQNSIMHVCSNIQVEKGAIKGHLEQKKVLDTISFNKEDETLFEKEKLVERINAIIMLLRQNIVLFNECVTNHRNINLEAAINFSEIAKDISEEYQNLNARIVDLSRSTDEILKLSNSYKSKKLELVKAKRIQELYTKFKECYVLRDYIQTLNSIKSGFNTTLITRKAKEAFKSIVEDTYIETFNQFCKELRVNKVDIKLTPQKGQTLRSKFIVSENYKVTDIMSEGEQKAIAMAEFATDLKIRRNYNTVLFDDPVTSLDYKRSELFAKLIYRFSKERQVVVFTHNIMFYYYLYNQCALSKDKENKFFVVDEFDKNNKGIVTESFSGRLENLSEVTKKLKAYEQKVNSKGCTGDDLQEALKSAYSDIRTWCELIVEEGFLKDLIKRYEPNIHFTVIKKIKTDFVNELETVAELFEKACRWMLGHSQPTESQNIKATKEDFNSDFLYIVATTDRYKKV